MCGGSKPCCSRIDECKKFVGDQLRNVMFEGDPEASSKAQRIVEGLSDADEHKSHDRHIPISKCRDLGLKVVALEDDDKLQDLVLTVHHCYMFVMMNTPTFKTIENQKGAIFSKMQQFQVQLPGPGLPQFPPQKKS